MDKQRVLIASVLSGVVVLVWLLFFAPKAPPPPMGPPLPPDLVAGKADGPGAAEPPPRAVGTPREAPPRDESILGPQLEATASAAVTGTAGSELRVRSESFDVVLSATGGVPRSWQLRKYRTTPAKLGDATGVIELMSPAAIEAGRRPLSVFTGDSDTDRRLASAVYVIEVDGVTGPVAELELAKGEKRRVRMRWADGAGASVEKSLEFDGGSYATAVRVRATVPPRSPWVFVGSAIADGADRGRKDLYVGRVAVAKGNDVTRPAFAGRQSAVDELLFRFGDEWPPVEKSWLGMLESSGQAQRFAGVDWAAVEESYFAAIAFAERPFGEVLVIPALRTGDTAHHMAVALPVPEDGRSFSLYMGPKDRNELEAVRPGLSGVIDLGWFESLAKALFWALAWIYSWVKNWGVAIILLTIVIKIGFLPLTIKQLNTMQKMVHIQPQMKAINDRYARKTGDAQARMEMNRQKQQEIMALYQKEGVNPMGGCVPMLLYLPFLYGFYAVLGTAIELRQAEFIGWVKDLSVKEHAPWEIPVMAILMMISMIVQQAITPTTMDPMQKRIMYIMPLMMTWVFKDLASGLVLFWLTNNVLSIIQQGWLNRLTRRREAEEKAGRRGGKNRLAKKEVEAK